MMYVLTWNIEKNSYLTNTEKKILYKMKHAKLSEKSIKWLEEYRKKNPVNENKLKNHNKFFNRRLREKVLTYLKSK